MVGRNAFDLQLIRSWCVCLCEIAQERLGFALIADTWPSMVFVCFQDILLGMECCADVMSKKKLRRGKAFVLMMGDDEKVALPYLVFAFVKRRDVTKSSVEIICARCDDR